MSGVGPVSVWQQIRISMVYDRKLVASAKSLSNPIESWACILAIEHPIRNKVAQIVAPLCPVPEKVAQIIEVPTAKWSDLRYGLSGQLEDHDGEAAQA